MKIRLMEITDYDALQDLWLNTAGLGLNSIDDSREGIEKYLRRNPLTCFVAEDEGRIIGGILAGHDGRRGFIYHLVASGRLFPPGGVGKSRGGWVRCLLGF